MFFNIFVVKLLYRLIGVPLSPILLKILLKKYIFFPALPEPYITHGQYLIFLQGVASKQSKNSSVKKLFLLAVVPEVPETYFNVKAILSSLNLEVIEFTAAADIKMCKCFYLFINWSEQKNVLQYLIMSILVYKSITILVIVLILIGKPGGKPAYGCPFCSARTPYKQGGKLYCLGDLLELHQVIRILYISAYGYNLNFLELC